MPQGTAIDFEQSARRDIAHWLLLAMGSLFLILSLSIAPSENCDESGHCYPLLVWIARAFGGFVALGSSVMLIRNPRRGIRFVPETGELLWWDYHKGAATSAAGRIPVSDVARIEILSDTDDITVRLIDHAGHPVPGFSKDVLPWPYHRWAEKLVTTWPRISLHREG